MSMITLAGLLAAVIGVASSIGILAIATRFDSCCLR
jgi:hypothetical protein